MVKILLACLFLASCITPYDAPEEDGIVIVEYGADWCWTCHHWKPILLREAAKCPAVFKYVDTDAFEDSHINGLYIPAIPKMSIFKDGLLVYHGWIPQELKDVREILRFAGCR